MGLIIQGLNRTTYLILPGHVQCLPLRSQSLRYLPYCIVLSFACDVTMSPLDYELLRAETVLLIPAPQRPGPGAEQMLNRCL